MPVAAFTELLRIAAIQFVPGSILVHWALRKAPQTPPHWRALTRALPHGLLPALIGFVVWVLRFWPQPPWHVLVALEILLAFVLLEMGLAALGRRFGRRPVFLILGWGYAAAVAILVPGGPGETLLAVTLLGAATLALGLGPSRT